VPRTIDTGREQITARERAARCQRALAGPAVALSAANESQRAYDQISFSRATLAGVDRGIIEAPLRELYPRTRGHYYGVSRIYLLQSRVRRKARLIGTGIGGKVPHGGRVWHKYRFVAILTINFSLMMGRQVRKKGFERL
jgi:hypothetical protein